MTVGQSQAWDVLGTPSLFLTTQNRPTSSSDVFNMWSGYFPNVEHEGPNDSSENEDSASCKCGLQVRIACPRLMEVGTALDIGRICVSYGYGSKSKIVPPVNIRFNPTTKIGTKMGGAFTYPALPPINMEPHQSPLSSMTPLFRVLVGGQACLSGCRGQDEVCGFGKERYFLDAVCETHLLRLCIQRSDANTNTGFSSQQCFITALILQKWRRMQTVQTPPAPENHW